MKKTYAKFLSRSVWRTRARFFSILAIVAIGVGFLSGLLAATPDMQLTVDNFYRSKNVHDINIKSTLGITNGDISALKTIEGVESVTPGYVTDVVMDSTDGSYVTRLYGMDANEVNGYTLIDGRMPENENECLISAPNNYTLSFKPGVAFSLSKKNKDYDKLGDTYSFKKVTAVGIVSSPLFFSVGSEPSNVGSGSVQLVMFMPKEAYAMEVYTDAFIRLSGMEFVNTFSDEYSSTVSDFTLRLEELGEERSALRHLEVISAAQDQIDDAKTEYQDGKNKAEKELAKAEKELKKGEKEIEDNEKKLKDGRQKLEDGKLELLNGETEYESGRQKLENGMAEIEANKIKLANSRNELNAAQEKLDTTIQTEKENFLASIPQLVENQYNSLSAQIDKGEADGKAKLDSAEAELEEGKKNLATGQAELDEKEAQLTAGYTQYEGGLNEYSQGLADLNQGKSDLQGAKEQLNQEISNKRAELEASKEQLTEDEYQKVVQEINAAEAAGLAELSATEAVLSSTEETLAAAKARLDATKEELDLGASALEAGKAKLEKAKTELDEGQRQLELGRKTLKNEIAEKRKELSDSRPAIEAAIKAEGLRQIEAGRLEGQQQINLGFNQLSQGESAIATAEADLNSGRAELAIAATKLAEARKVIVDSEEELADGEKKLNQGIKDLNEGKKTYAQEKAKATKELSDAKIKIEDAQKEIGDIKVPQWMIFDREDILSFSSYKGDSGKVSAIATIFPIFFFMVAALVALTTMTRLVEEERTQIGVFKALGYSNKSIVFYYLGYSVLASFIGSVLGVLAGTYGLPPVIAGAYDMSYSAPNLELKFWWGQAAIIVLTAIACTTAAAWAACMTQLKEKPSSLMQPRAPQAGKRILLERITPLWKRFSFTEKITARNIFRYKKRLVMTAFGIAGCTALLLTGLGLKDSIQDISRKQFGEIYKYDASLIFKDGKSAENRDVLGYLQNKELVSDYLKIHAEKGYSGSRSYTIYSPEKPYEFKDHINLRTLKGGTDIAFNESSAVLTQKLSEALGAKVGDTVTVKNNNGVKGEVIITGVAENYIMDFLFISPQLYKTTFNAPLEYTEALIKMADDTKQLKDSFSQDLLDTSQVLLLMYNETIENSFNDSVKNIDSIVYVLIASAGALAMIVLYNLTNINICERKKELATIKVLGFHQGELAGYIYRETTILCVIGILAGLFVGIFLHAFVISTAEVDAAMFGRTIYPLSYVLSAALTLLFTAIVDVIMLKKLRKIDMVESMKANE